MVDEYQFVEYKTFTLYLVCFIYIHHWIKCIDKEWDHVKKYLFLKMNGCIIIKL